MVQRNPRAILGAILLAIAAFGTVQGVGLLTLAWRGYSPSGQVAISAVYFLGSGLLVWGAVLALLAPPSRWRSPVIAVLASATVLVPFGLLGPWGVIRHVGSVPLSVAFWVPAAVFVVGSWWYFFSLWMRRRQSRQTPEQGYVQ